MPPMITRYDSAYVLNVVSLDHPGIVAAVSAAVEQLGGNIDACSQTVLAGYFTLIMVVSLPRPVAPADLADAVRDAPEDGSDLQVIATPFRPPAPAPSPAVERFVITAFGEDRPGIVRRFSRYLAGKGINIIDLYGDRTGGQGPGGRPGAGAGPAAQFVLISQVEIPTRWDVAACQADLERMGAEEGFTVRLQHENIFVATNQLRCGGQTAPPGVSHASH